MEFATAALPKNRTAWLSPVRRRFDDVNQRGVQITAFEFIHSCSHEFSRTAKRDESGDTQEILIAILLGADLSNPRAADRYVADANFDLRSGTIHTSLWLGEMAGVKSVGRILIFTGIELAQGDVLIVIQGKKNFLQIVSVDILSIL